MRIAIYTLGCKVNQYETQALEGELTKRGHTLVNFTDEADVYVVNTCSVTAISDKKSRQMLRQAKRRNPNAIIAACGCYAQTHEAEVRALAPDVLFGTNDRTRFLDAIEEAYQKRRPVISVDDVWARRSFELLPAGGLDGRTRAMMKIEDGCVNFCSYCIIPYARGRVRSLPMEKAREQIISLREAGYREVVLTGIEISSYGKDLDGDVSLIDLLELLSRESGGMRLRLGSLEPRTVTEEFCRRAAALPNLCPHFHLSMQSGCDETLRRMNRKYDTARFLKSCDLLRRWFESPAITTDLIVGFPEETDAEFAATLDFIRRCAFAEIHIFPYSIRPGTKAAEMKQLPNAIKEERAQIAAQVAEEMQTDYLSACIGKEFDVLFEQDIGGRSVGHAPNYAEVSVAAKGLHNVIKRVKIVALEGHTLLAEGVER